jgi:hypothetical protein
MGMGLSAGSKNFRIELTDNAGTVLQTIKAASPKPAWAEFSGPDGGIERALARQPLSVELETIPLGATKALIAHSSLASPAVLALGAAKLPKAAVWRDDLKSDARFTVLLLAEWFTDPERFWQACAQFENTLFAQPPFATLGPAGIVGVTGAWWPSSPAKGLFETREHEIRRIYGDGGKAMKAAKSVRKADLTIVLIDSPNWGGAGGAMGDRPAWASIVGFDPQWPGMAVHEMGHAFGLMDEYEDEGPKIAYKPGFPNVSDKRDAAKTVWKDQISQGIPLNPTQPNPPGHALPDNSVGTFEGALYKARDLYRPSADCRMRHTHVPFCKVCAAHISERLGA